MYKERGNAHWRAPAAQMSKLPKYCSPLTSFTAGRSTQAKFRSTIRLILLPGIFRKKLKEEIIFQNVSSSVFGCSVTL